MVFHHNNGRRQDSHHDYGNYFIVIHQEKGSNANVDDIKCVFKGRKIFRSHIFLFYIKITLKEIICNYSIKIKPVSHIVFKTISLV